MKHPARFSFLAAVCVFAFLLGSPVVWGQATTSLRGTITDPSGAAIPNATVHLVDTDTSLERTTTAGAQGTYIFLEVPPGSYTLRIDAVGFEKYQQVGIQLQVSLPATVNVKMKIGSAQETVTVTESAAPINTTDATLGNNFGTLQITTLPFDGLDATQILSLQPGVVYLDPTATDATNDSRSGSVNGGRSDQTNVTVDGLDNNDQLNGYAFTGALRTTLESTEEFRVTTANGNADQGRSSGAQVSLITKSGTNSPHGSLYEANRNIYGRANNWFNKNAESLSDLPNVPPGFVRNVFGGAVGGPVKKDRLFFYFNYEGLRQRQAAQVTQTVPSASMRDGVIMYQCDPAAAAQCPGGMVTGYSGATYPVPAGDYGLTPANIASMDQQAVANGNCLNPANTYGVAGCGPSLNVLNYFKTALNGGAYPLPNTDSVGDTLDIRGFTFPSGNPVNQNTSTLRLDYNITSNGNHKLFVRGQLQDDSALGTVEFPGQPASTTNPGGNRGIFAGYTAVLRSNLVNDLRYSFIRQSGGIGGLNDTQHEVFLRGITDPTAFTRSTTTIVPVHNLVDTLSWTKGKHTLEFGGNFRQIDNERSSFANSFFDAQSNVGALNVTAIAGTGTDLDPSAQADGCPAAQCPWVFPAVASGFSNSYDFAMLALVGAITEIDARINYNKQGAQIGTPVQGSQFDEGAPVIRHFRDHEGEGFLQDSWRMKPNVTLTFGARYSLLQPPYETTGTQVAPTTSIGDEFATREKDQQLGIVYNPVLRFDLSGQANGKKPYWNWDYKDVAPRLALAWSPGFSSGLLGLLFGGPGKSSIRMGYGIYFDHFGEGIVNTFDQEGSFGLSTSEGNPLGVLGVSQFPRFIDRFTIPDSPNAETGPMGLFSLLSPPSTGSFPRAPAVGGFDYTWGLDDRLKTPYSHTFDFSIERDLGHNYSLDLAYVGRLGRRLLSNIDLGMPLDLTDPASKTDYFSAAKNFDQLARANVDMSDPRVQSIPFWQNLFPTAAGVLNGCAPNATGITNPTATQEMYNFFSCYVYNETTAIQNTDTCVPVCATINGVSTPFAFYLQQYVSLYGWASIGDSDYHSFQVSLRKTMSSGLMFDLNYTLSKSTDIGSDAERVCVVCAGSGFSSDIINAWKPSLQHALSDFDTTHQINANWVYQLPLGRGRRYGSDMNRALDAVVGGWQIAGLGRWTSGFPFNVGTIFGFPTNWYLTGNADQIGNPKTGSYYELLSGASNKTENVFANPSSAFNDFTPPYPGEAGARNTLRGPGYFGIDASLQKVWSLGESRTLRLSWDTFNVTNTVRFDAQSSYPGLFGGAASFGNYSTMLNDGRKMQFDLRFAF